MSDVSDLEFAPRSAFDGLALPGTGSGDVFVTDRDGLGLATVLVRKGQEAALAARVKERFAIDLPQGPRRAAAGGVAFAGTGPGAWLATSEAAGNALAVMLRQALGVLASVSDQTDGYATLRLAGPKARDTLERMVSIDLHPEVFKPGDIAATLAAHMAINLWRLEDAADGSPVFELTVFRSLAQSLWHVLAESAAQFGLVVLPPDRSAQEPVASAHPATVDA